MIQANELRIGNWVEHKKEWSHRSAGIVAPFFFQWEDRDWYALGESTMDLDAVQAIPLTPKILKGAGFDKLDPYDIYSNCKIGIAVHGDGYQIERSIAFKYVHQLQNLYYAMTGEELKINLT